MISKGRFRYLRKKYRGIVTRKRFIANIAWQCGADSINNRTYDPKAIEEALEDFRSRAGFRWGDVFGTAFEDNEFHVVVEHPKTPSYLMAQRGKHRQSYPDGEKVYKIYQIDDLQGKSRPLTPEELEAQDKFSDYLTTLGEQKLEDVLVKPMRTKSLADFTDADCQQWAENTKFVANLWGWADGKQDQPGSAAVPHVSVSDHRA
ncbi:hypothetical protein [Pseudomonas phage D6]|nr:hypothetical protein [Pseudomonas phage D6]